MTRIARIVASGYPHHVTQRGVRSINIFHSDDDRRNYLQAVKEETERFDVEILSWCLMNNHVHFIAVPQQETSLANGFGTAHKRYTRMKNFADGARGYLFQGRFGSCVLDERHLLAAVRYVEANPVRAGIARFAWYYPWSSAAFHVGDVDTDFLVKDRSLLGLVDDWRVYLCNDQDLPTEKIRKATRTSRPAGDDCFIEKMEQLTGRSLGKQKPGRHPKI
ncbi:MAG: transposase [Deltaproteobacteria bacterium HGW-Deltaproteobacteria-12]|jgi:putative transposase|nr:MAG: transposase [Deltaproteobacteria bacterium HGW-Deltaproteobacteria-12]